MQTMHFEAEELAKKEKLDKEIEVLLSKTSHKFFEIFKNEFVDPDQINAKSNEKIAPEDTQAMKECV